MTKYEEELKKISTDTRKLWKIKFDSRLMDKVFGSQMHLA